MSTVSSQQEDYQYSGNHSDDDTYSTGGDSGFSMGADDEKLMKEEQAAIMVLEPSTSTSFFSRLAAIPIVQDSFMGAQNIVRQNAVGQKALEYAETKLQTIVASAQPYTENNNLFIKANNIGIKSLDMLERQFPSISSPTKDLVQPITGCIESAVSHLMEKKCTMIDTRIDYVAGGFESIVGQYLPPSADGTEEEEEQDDENTKHGVDRLMKVVNILSTRSSKMISRKLSATMEEEKQLKQMIRSWILEQANTMTNQPVFIKGHENFKTLYDNSVIQVMYNFTQLEFDKVRQEFGNANISHVDRIRNILALSQTDILYPLLEKSRSIWTSQKKMVHDEQQVTSAA